MRKFKLLITSHSFGSADAGIFEELSGAGIEYRQIHSKEILRENELLEIVEEFDGIIVGADQITEKVIQKGENLKIIAKHGVGLDNIDLEAAKKRGIKVSVARGANNVAVAELAVAMIFSLARGVAQSTREIKEGKWLRRRGVEISGATLGVIGTGSIGKEVIKRMAACGMNIIAYDPAEDREFLNAYGGSYVPLDKLIAQSDFVTVHIPLTEKTRHLIHEENLKQMKSTAYLINCARGGIVDEDALYKALKNNRLAGAGIDTFVDEPPGNNQLLELENVVMTPHLGAYTKQAIEKMSRLSAQSIVQFVSGKRIENEIAY